MRHQHNHAQYHALQVKIGEFQNQLFPEILVINITVL